jgi:hypothetical protein
MRAFSFAFPALAVLSQIAAAQITATYAPFGTGCPGTGTGLGGNHVVPASMTNAFGGSDNSIPFTWSPVRYQQVFLGSDLPSAFTMAGLSLRQDERGPVAHGVTVDLEIQVGYTTRTPQTMTTTFAANFDSGAPIVVLPRAQIIFPDQPANPTNPAEFFMTIAWATTFAWVPAPSRNFLVQVTVFGNSNGGFPWGYPLDATGGATGRLYGSPASATTGTYEVNYGLVMGLRALTQTAVPILYSTSTPQIGNTFRVRLAQARPQAPVALCLGASSTSWAGLPLPMDLGWLGGAGCSLLTAIDVVTPVTTNSAGAASFSYVLPNDIYLLRGRFYNQFVITEPTVNVLGLVLSNAGAGVIGNQ